MAHEGHDHEHDHDHDHDHGHDHSHSQAHDHEHETHDHGHETHATNDHAHEHTHDHLHQLLHVDPVAGAAGDMLIAAFLDLGVDEAALRAAVDAIGLTGFELKIGRRERHAIAARSFDVLVEGTQPPRDYATIDALLEKAPLPPRVRELARHAFLRLGEAEAKVHRQPLARVHFHEVGGVDAIVDIVGASACIAWLEERAGGVGALGVSLGPIPVGGGRARGAHGSIPVPAPAALELLLGLPTRDAGFPEGEEKELVTPTGAALLRTFVERLPRAPAPSGRWPAMSPRAIGYGAGTRDLKDRPNVVRLVLGDVEEAHAHEHEHTHDEATHVVLEANVDDTTGEIAGATLEALMHEGALDAWAQPITMKKGRPALMIAALTDHAHRAAIARSLLAHTGSLGVRMREVSRLERARRFVDVSTAYGTIRVKIADGDGLPLVVHPELDVCRAAAEAHHVPVREVIRAAIAAASV